MNNYEVKQTQLAIYFIFTILSLIISLIVYCLYFHAFLWAKQDYIEQVQSLMKMVERKILKEDTVK